MKFLKWLLICCVGGFAVIFIIGYIIFGSMWGNSDCDYSVTELKEHFEKNKPAIYELKRFFKEVVPQDMYVEIEFENDKTLSRFGFGKLNRTTKTAESPYYLQWDLSIGQLDSLIQPLG